MTICSIWFIFRYWCT